MEQSRVLQESTTIRLQETPEVIWDIISQTETLNRTIGIPPIRFSSIETNQGQIFRIAHARYGLFSFSWKEYPFEWSKPTFYSVERDFFNGPFAKAIMRIDLTPSEHGTNVRVSVAAEPRGLLGLLIGRLFLKEACRRASRYLLEKIEARPQDKRTGTLQQSLLDERLATFRDNPIVLKLKKFLEEGTDDQVAAIRPMLLASRLREDPEILTRVLLQLVRAGVLTLSWKILCPMCRVPKAESDHLNSIPNGIHCDLCERDIPTTREDMIEMQLKIHPSIRKVSTETFCVGGPFATPHILAQIALTQNKAKEFVLQSDISNLQLRALQKPGIYPIMNRGVVEAEYKPAGWALKDTPSPSNLLRGTLQNRSDQPIIAVVEDAISSRTAFTLKKILSMQEFRDFFADEILTEGTEIAIEQGTFLFTDLTSSTSMYETKGDAPAYVEVRRHFDILKDIVSENHGAIVKTIGDAIMAVFSREQDALNAGLQICLKANEFAKLFMRSDPKVVRVGIYSGSSVVSSANGRIDYFGKTVNRAARIQSQSEGGDLVAPAVLLSQPSCRDVLAGYAYTENKFFSPLKGIKGEFDLVRLHEVKLK